MFGTPERFVAMVRAGYPVVYRRGERHFPAPPARRGRARPGRPPHRRRRRALARDLPPRAPAPTARGASAAATCSRPAGKMRLRRGAAHVSFLAVDIGNTRLKWALYAKPLPGATTARPRRGLPRGDRRPRRRTVARSARAVEHARQRRRRRGRASPHRGAARALGRRAALGREQRRSLRRHQRLRPSDPARRRPLGRADRRAPPHPGARSGAAGARRDGRHRGHRRRARHRAGVSSAA